MPSCKACGCRLPTHRRAGTLFCSGRCRMRALRAQRQHAEVEALVTTAMEPLRRCAQCSKPLPPRARKGTRFCTKECKNRSARRSNGPPSGPPSSPLAPGLAQAVLILLRARGIELTAPEQARIRDCQDEEGLSRSVCIAAGLGAKPLPDRPEPTHSLPPEKSAAAPAAAVPAPPPLREAPPRAPQRTSLPSLPLGGDIHTVLAWVCKELVLLSLLRDFKQGAGAERAALGFFQGIQLVFGQAADTRKAVGAAAPPSQQASTLSVDLIQTHLLPLLDNLYQCHQDRAKSPAVSAEPALRDLLDLALATMVGGLDALGVMIHHPLGEPLDDRVDEVAWVMENSQALPGTILAVTQLGIWAAGDLLRAARVVVATAPRAGLEAGAPQQIRPPTGSVAQAVGQALPTPAGVDAAPSGARGESLRPTSTAAPPPSPALACALPLASLPGMPVDPDLFYALSILQGQLTVLILLGQWKQQSGASAAVLEFFESISRVNQQALGTLQHLREVSSAQAQSALPLELLEPDLLPLLDSLYRGRHVLAQSPALAGEPGLRELMDLVLALYLSTLQVWSVYVSEPLGKPFESHRDELALTVEYPGAAPGTIVQVLQLAVWLDRDLIRAARVVVAGPLPGSPERGANHMRAPVSG